MRVLIFAPNYLPATRYGGPVRSAHGLAKGLVETGHDVTVLTTDVDGPGRLDVPLGQPVELDGVKVIYCAIDAPRRLYHSAQMARLAADLVPQVDVVHVNGVFLWPGPFLAGLARRHGKRVVISPRGMLMPDLVAGKSRWVKTAWIALRERPALARAHAIHLTSEGEQAGLLDMGLGLAPQVILGNGVEPPAPGQEPTEADIDAVWQGIAPGRRVACLARLDWTKGIDLAIEAVRACPGATLLIAGHDQIGLRAKLEPQLTRPDGSVAGAFLGPLDGAAKWALLKGADVVMAPSVRESFGMSVAEALLMGTPTIVTPGVGARTILERIDPALVTERTAEALAQTLGALLDDDARRARIGAQAQQIMTEDYSWAGIARQMAQVYGAPGTATAAGQGSAAANA